MKLIVYSKANCPQCVQLKKQLEQSGLVEFTEVRVDLNPEARQFLLDQGHRSVPQIYQVVDGCDRAAYVGYRFADVAQ